MHGLTPPATPPRPLPPDALGSFERLAADKAAAQAALFRSRVGSPGRAVAIRQLDLARAAVALALGREVAR